MRRSTIGARATPGEAFDPHTVTVRAWRCRPPHIGPLARATHQDPDDPRMFVWSEVYADDESLLFHLTNPPLQKFVQQHSEEYGDGFSIEIYGTLDAETKEKFSATGFPIKYFDTRLGYSRCRK